MGFSGSELLFGVWQEVLEPVRGAEPRGCLFASWASVLLRHGRTGHQAWKDGAWALLMEEDFFTGHQKAAGPFCRKKAKQEFHKCVPQTLHVPEELGAPVSFRDSLVYKIPECEAYLPRDSRTGAQIFSALGKASWLHHNVADDIKLEIM